MGSSRNGRQERPNIVGKTPGDNSDGDRPPLFALATPQGDAGSGEQLVRAVRLARHQIRLDDGHVVGVAIAGRGMPLVVAHGFTGQGLLYVQTLSRLVSMGFKVIAIDMPGHGRTPLPRRSPLDLSAYGRLVSRAVEQLGIRQAMFFGHSMGGRLVVDMADEHPDRVVALILADAIVGRPWDAQVARMRTCPPRGLLKLAQVGIDCAYSVPLVGDPAQSLKLGSLLLRANIRSHFGRLVAPAVAMGLVGPSEPVLDRLRARGIRSVVVHADNDLAVPLATGRDTAARLRAELTVVLRARHAWPLSDPETLPAIMVDLLAGPLGHAWNSALLAKGLDPADATHDEIEDALYEPGAQVLDLTPPLSFTRAAERRRPARYHWKLEGIPTLEEGAVSG
jgi:pimeloyl-ACP methyl ester carboxylesterase